MTPLNLEGLLNPILSEGVPSGPTRANRLPSGHANFDSGNLGLMKDLSRRILVIKVFPTSLGLEEIKDEAAEDAT